jgi:hypothetical protein
MTNAVTAVVTTAVRPHNAAIERHQPLVRFEVNTARGQWFRLEQRSTTGELSVTVTATKPTSANKSTFSLLSPHAGMTINPTSGAISWTPAEAQGPSTNLITVVAADDGVPSLSSTNTFTVVVREVNVAPTLEPIPDRSALNGASFTLQVVAADADLPANRLTFSLEGAPAGMTIDAATGAISWTPAQAQTGAHNATVRVTDNGTPALSATAAFQVTVTGQELRLAIQPVAGGLMQVQITGDISLNYELQVSSDLKNWERLLEFRLPRHVQPYRSGFNDHSLAVLSPLVEGIIARASAKYIWGARWTEFSSGTKILALE